MIIEWWLCVGRASKLGIKGKLSIYIIVFVNICRICDKTEWNGVSGMHTCRCYTCQDDEWISVFRSYTAGGVCRMSHLQIVEDYSSNSAIRHVLRLEYTKVQVYYCILHLAIDLQLPSVSFVPGVFIVSLANFQNIWMISDE